MRYRVTYTISIKGPSCSVNFVSYMLLFIFLLLSLFIFLLVFAFFTYCVETLFRYAFYGWITFSICSKTKCFVHFSTGKITSYLLEPFFFLIQKLRSYSHSMEIFRDIECKNYSVDPTVHFFLTSNYLTEEIFIFKNNFLRKSVS